MQKLLTSFEIDEAKISSKGRQRLVIIPKSHHDYLKNLEDKQYLINVKILSIPNKKELLHITAIKKISKMGKQRQFYIPEDYEKQIKPLKDQYIFVFEIQERS